MQNAGFHTLLNCLKCIVYEDCYSYFSDELDTQFL